LIYTQLGQGFYVAFLFFAFSADLLDFAGLPPSPPARSSPPPPVFGLLQPE
jgi:hypothetical protein